MSKRPPPENLRYPFGRAIPTNFRWKGTFTECDEYWWQQYGEACARNWLGYKRCDPDRERPK